MPGTYDFGLPIHSPGKKDGVGDYAGTNRSPMTDRYAAAPETSVFRRDADGRPAESGYAGTKYVEKVTAEEKLVYGQAAAANPVPVDTYEDALRDRRRGKLCAAFEDIYGQRFALNGSALSKHLLLLGGIGSGKTNVFQFLTESLLYYQRPEDIVLIFDTKGDFHDQFYQPDDPDHILIGNNDCYAGETWYWNVFGELEETRSGSAAWEFTAKEIGKQFLSGRESETQPFFALAAADLIAKVLIDFRRQAQKSGDLSRLNNEALANWFRSARLPEYTDMIQRPGNEDFASALLYFGGGQKAPQNLTPQALGVFGSIVSACNDLLTGVFARHCPGREFSMRSLVRNRGRNGGRTVVFIEYDLSVGEVLGPIYRILIDMALKEALGQDARRQGSVLCVIDEFKLLPNLMHIDDALNFGRSLGIKVFAGLQSIDQIYAIYGEERGRAILSGFMSGFFFHTPDSASREYISKRLGENYYHILYKDTTLGNQSMAREGRAVEDWELSRLPVGHAAVDLDGNPPFLFTFLNFEDPHQPL